MFRQLTMKQRNLINSAQLKKIEHYYHAPWFDQRVCKPSADVIKCSLIVNLWRTINHIEIVVRKDE